MNMMMMLLLMMMAVMMMLLMIMIMVMMMMVVMMMIITKIITIPLQYSNPYIVFIYTGEIQTLSRLIYISLLRELKPTA